MNIPKNALHLIGVLEKNGYEAYFVGGCVRDMLFGRCPKDFDIASSGLPEEIIMALGGAGIKALDYAKQHGSISALMDKEIYEITTYRKDGEYSDARRPDSVEFTPDIKADLLRRDFTINALAYHPDRGIIDIVGGERDIENGIIRAVGDGRLRFSEDSLRILRAFRFMAQLGFEIEEETLSAAVENRDSLRNLSKERVRAEFVKILCSETPSRTLRLMASCGITGFIVPEFLPSIGFDQQSPHHIYTVDEHIYKVVDSSPEGEIPRTAAFFHDIAKPETFFLGKEGRGHFPHHPAAGAEIARIRLAKLGYEKATIREICLLIRYHDDYLAGDRIQMKIFLKNLGIATTKKLIDLQRADSLAKADFIKNRSMMFIDKSEEIYHDILMQGEVFSLAGLAVNGDDLMDIFLLSGRNLGEMLELVLEKVILGELANEKDDIVAFVNMCEEMRDS